MAEEKDELDDIITNATDIVKNIMEMRIQGKELIPVAVRNRDKVVFNHNEYGDSERDFDMGFFEACDFFQYIKCSFSIASAVEIWPPRGDYEIQRTYEITKNVDGSESKILKWNHFWEKFDNCGQAPYLFYARLDPNARGKLYFWYKTNVKKDL